MYTMKNTHVIALFSILVLFTFLAPASIAGNDQPGQPKAALALKINPEKSTVNWLGKKVTGEHNGTVKITDGTLYVENNRLQGGEFAIDMNSIQCLDLTDAEYNAKLVGHLKSDDFFAVEKHPKATLKITGAKPLANAKAGASNYEITGDLTIKGITHSITFPANVKINGNKADASASIVVDRSKYDVRYGSKSFFDGLGDKMIYDEFTLDVKLVADADTKQAANAVQSR
jgi:polyisoprenoid-binding protein YceI